eukprot:2268466-Rhodomonas_salina.1
MASTSVQCSAQDPFVQISPSAHALVRADFCVFRDSENCVWHGRMCGTKTEGMLVRGGKWRCTGQLGQSSLTPDWVPRELVVAARLEAVQVKGKGAMGTFCLTKRGGEGRSGSTGWVSGTGKGEEKEGDSDGEGEGMQLRDAQHRA